MTGGPRVLIIDDHGLLAQSLCATLQSEGLEASLAVLGATGEMLAAAGRLAPSVVLLDLDLGPGCDRGEVLLPGLVALGAHVIVVSGVTDPGRLGGCLELGAVAVLSKTRSLDEILAAVRACLAGREVVPDPERQRLLADMRAVRAARSERLAPFERLTARERDVLHLMLQGRPAEAIAAHFVVSQATVRTQIRAVLTKLGVNSQLAAVAMATRVDWAA